MKKKRILLGLALTAAAVFSLASCGSSNDDSSTATATSAVATSKAASTSTSKATATSTSAAAASTSATATSTPAASASATDPTASATDPTATTTGEADPTTTTTTTGEADPYADYIAISTVAELNEFRKGNVNPTAKYMLTNDIDFEGQTLEVTAIVFKGVLDGRGYTIKNASYTDGTKTGFLAATAMGATFTNIKFLNVTAQASLETLSIVAGVVGGDCEFSNLEFNSCSVRATSYPGLIFGRTNGSGGTYNIKGITVKNGSYSEGGASYGGVLTGDISGGVKDFVNVSDIDIAAEFKTSTKNGGFLLGRVRDNANVSVKNAIIREAIMASGNNNGLITGGTKNLTSLDIDNVVVLKAENYFDIVSSTANTLSITNVYTTDSTIVASSSSKYAKTALTAVSDYSTTWLKDTMKLDFENTWVTEGEDNSKYRLASSSTNVRSADATISSIKLMTGNAVTRFHQGATFTQGDLAVMATYSDGVQLILNSSEFTVNSSAYDATKAGIYTITVSSVEKNADGAAVTATYDVSVVEQTGFSVNSEFAVKTYTAGSDLSTTNVFVYSEWSDGVQELLSDTDYSTYGVEITDDYDKSVAGEYTVTITGANQYTKVAYDNVTYKVSVVATQPTVVDNYVYINVDAKSTYYDGATVKGVETFKTITSALDYLVACGLDASVNKVIFVANGVYNEKITVAASLSNLSIVGEDWEKTKITYSAVEDTYSVVNEKAYGLDCATLQVNATNFGLYNITINNDFDYINDASKYGSPQGLALTINGDQATISHVHLYGNQDTLYLKKGRAYFDDCIIEGNVDFIFGQPEGLAYFDKCLINSVDRCGEKKNENNGYVTAMKAEEGKKPNYGYIFNECALTADGDYTTDTLPTEGVAVYFSLTHNFDDEDYNVLNGSNSLGRTWGPKATVSFINCSFTASYSTLDYDGSSKSRWFKMSGEPTGADFSEYGSTGDGAITEAVVGGKLLTETEAENYTLANIFAKTNGDIKWDTDYAYATALTTLKALAKTDATSIALASADDTDTTDSVITLNIERNKTAEVTYAVNPWNASNKEVTIVVNDPTIASYNNGVITGLAEGNTTVTFTCGTLSVDVEVTVVAPTGTYTVSFIDSDGTTVLNTSTTAAGDAIQYPTDPIKDGYTFVGWYAEKDYINKYTATTTPEADVKVYARYYQKNVEGVTYVSTAADLVTAITNNSVVYLTADIDFTGVDYAGNTANFTGSVYGYGFAIKNWTVAGAAESTSFFGKTYQGTLDSIIFKDCSITTDAKYVAILTSGSYADETINCITFDNCSITNALADSAATNVYTGLIAGAGNLGAHNDVSVLTVSNIFVTNSTVAASQYSGGLFGYLNAGDITVDGLYGDITFNAVGSNNKNAGGIIGWAKDHLFTLKNADVAITLGAGSQNLGGVIGGLQYNAAATGLTVSDSDIRVTSGEGKVIGGIVGITYASSTTTISNVKLDLAMTSTNESIGGIAGRHAGSMTVTDLNVTGSINAKSRTGSIAGYVNNAAATLTINSAYAHDLTITNTNSSESNVFVGRSDTTDAIDYTNATYKNVVITLNGTAATIDQGTEVTE